MGSMSPMLVPKSKLYIGKMICIPNPVSFQTDHDDHKPHQKTDRARAYSLLFRTMASMVHIFLPRPLPPTSDSRGKMSGGPGFWDSPSDSSLIVDSSSTRCFRCCYPAVSVACNGGLELRWRLMNGIGLIRNRLPFFFSVLPFCCPLSDEGGCNPPFPVGLLPPPPFNRHPFPFDETDSNSSAVVWDGGY